MNSLIALMLCATYILETDRAIRRVPPILLSLIISVAGTVLSLVIALLSGGVTVSIPPGEKFAGLLLGAAVAGTVGAGLMGIALVWTKSFALANGFFLQPVILELLLWEEGGWTWNVLAVAAAAGCVWLSFGGNKYN